MVRRMGLVVLLWLCTVQPSVSFHFESSSLMKVAASRPTNRHNSCTPGQDCRLPVHPWEACSGPWPYPTFDAQVIEDKVLDGYAVTVFDVNNDGLNDVVTHGLALGNVVWYENPTWVKHNISQLSKPVQSAPFDVDGDGFMDIGIGHNYGSCAFDCQQHDGTASWLRNNVGATGTQEANWTVYDIDPTVMAVHRNFWGHFTTTEAIQWLIIPIVGHPPGIQGVHNPVKVMLYTKPTDPSMSPWPAEMVDSTHFSLTHGMLVVPNWPGSAPGLNAVLVGAEQGLFVMYFQPGPAKWHVQQLGIGQLSTFDPSRLPYSYKGSGSVALGFWNASHTTPLPFICALEALHGNTLALYTPPAEGLASTSLWNRSVIDVYGSLDLDPSSTSYGQGPTHEIRAHDFDCDGFDEVIVTLRGPPPFQGHLYYKAELDTKGYVVAWHRANLSTVSSASIGIADLNGDGAADFASVSYWTPGYYEAADPKTEVYYNTMPNGCETSRTAAQAAVNVNLDPIYHTRGINIQFADPGVHDVSATPDWSIAGWRFRFIQIAPDVAWMLPPASAGARQFVKVITGSLLGFRAGESETFAVGAPRKMRSNAVEAGVVELKAGSAGALIAFFEVAEEAVGRKITTMASGPIQAISGPFAQVINWHRVAEALPAFKGVDFWNLKGFTLTTHDGTRVAYMQWWTSGNGVDCGYHNHQEWNSSTTFGEIHMCAYVGSGSGGLQYKTDQDMVQPCQQDIVLPYLTGYEHGPLWFVNITDGTPIRNSTSSQILYPFHRAVSGGHPNSPQYSYDVWIAFELMAAYTAINVPVNLLPQYANATL